MQQMISGLAMMDAFARDFLARLVPASSGATIIGLSGELGSGKTTFTQAVGRLMGVRHAMQSPTFVIMKRYETIDARFTELVHIDAYRLNSGAELLKLRWQDVCARPHTLVFLEWPERVADALSKEIRTLSFRFVDETTREIIF